MSLRLPEDTKEINKKHGKFSSKLDYQEKKITPFTTSYDEHLQDSSTNNIAGKKLMQQHQNLKQQLKWNLIKSHLTAQKSSTLSTWNYQLPLKINWLSLHTNFLHTMKKFIMISYNGHYSNHLKNIHKHENSPKIYLPWPLKVTLSFEFKNGGMLSFTPSSNIY